MMHRRDQITATLDWTTLSK